MGWDRKLGKSTPPSVALWAEILQHMPQQQRLRQCAVVSQSWASAAAQATVHVDCELRLHTLPAFQSWLDVHAGQLRHVRLSNSGDLIMLQLPLNKLTKLQHLKLEGFTLQLPGDVYWSGSSTSRDNAAQQALPSLQHVELKTIELVNVGSLSQLTRAPQLDSLVLDFIGFVELEFRPSNWGNPETVQLVAAALPGLLQGLPQLKLLKLPGLPITDAALQQVATMHGLQHLLLSNNNQGEVACDLQRLPSSLTEIKLYNYTLPLGVPQLPGLLSLNLYGCDVPPNMLGGFTQLQSLHIQDCTFQPVNGDADEGPAALLQALPKLTLLQDLKLDSLDLGSDISAPQQYSALTASSHLTQLCVTQEDNAMPLPWGAAQHMFPPGRQMQSLQDLTISTGGHVDPDFAGFCINGEDIGCIISCCPNLQWLNIRSCVQQGADLSVLSHLPETCKSLLVGGPAFTDAAVPVILQLTQLHYLALSFSPGFTDAGLEQLVELDFLQTLYVHSCGVSEQISPGNGGTINVEYDEDLGFVSQQLDAMLDNSPVLALARLKKLRLEYNSLL